MTDAHPDADADARRSPLDAVHVAAGASFTDFAGWQMPVRYSSDLAEHHAVRQAAGLFDLSHMAEILVDGPGAAAALDFALTARISAVEIGQAKYSLLLAEDGGVIDDLVVYRLGEQRFLVVANAGNRQPAVEAITERAASFDCVVDDVSDETALIAVQGPRSREILEAAAGLEVDRLDALRYYRATRGSFQGEDVLVARTGYTGEDGFELYIDAEAGVALWEALAAAGEPFGAAPAGLAARDTLRLEAGMPLYGHELTRATRPEQVGASSAVVLGKEGGFVGEKALAEPLPADAPVLVGLVAEGRRAGRADYPVFATAEDADPAGIVTSGALSPTLSHPIAMAMIRPDLAEVGTTVFIDVRGTRLPATVTALPFYSRKKN